MTKKVLSELVSRLKMIQKLFAEKQIRSNAIKVADVVIESATASHLGAWKELTGNDPQSLPILGYVTTKGEFIEMPNVKHPTLKL